MESVAGMAFAFVADAAWTGYGILAKRTTAMFPVRLWYIRRSSTRYRCASKKYFVIM